MVQILEDLQRNSVVDLHKLQEFAQRLRSFEGLPSETIDPAVFNRALTIFRDVLGTAEQADETVGPIEERIQQAVTQAWLPPDPGAAPPRLNRLNPTEMSELRTLEQMLPATKQ